MNSTENTILYDHDSNRVTPTQLQVGGQSYTPSDITSVSLAPPILKKQYGYLLAAVGIILLVAGYLIWGIFLTPMFVGVVLIIAGLALAVTVKQHYMVRLNQNNGMFTTLQFPNQSQAEQFITALNHARGQS